MPSEIFQASRWTRGNLLFPTYIEVSDKAVSRRKRSWFRMDEMSMSISKVASVHIKTGLIWSEILIESSGGSDPMASHGHNKGEQPSSEFRILSFGFFRISAFGFRNSFSLPLARSSRLSCSTHFLPADC